jgi:hypothetical protein
MVGKVSGVDVKVAVGSILAVGVAKFSTVAGIAVRGEQDISERINNEAIQNLLKGTS